MRLHTEAFHYIPVPLSLLLLTLAGVLVLSFVLYHWEHSLPPAVRRGLWALSLIGMGLMVVFAVLNQFAGPNSAQLGIDLKEQLGIEKVSYDDEYRELTGEKDGTVVFCVLTEEGDRGNIYEVICK